MSNATGTHLDGQLNLVRRQIEDKLFALTALFRKTDFLSWNLGVFEDFADVAYLFDQLVALGVIKKERGLGSDTFYCYVPKEPVSEPDNLFLSEAERMSIRSVLERASSSMFGLVVKKSTFEQSLSKVELPQNMTATVVFDYLVAEGFLVSISEKDTDLYQFKLVHRDRCIPSPNYNCWSIGQHVEFMIGSLHQLGPGNDTAILKKLIEQREKNMK